MVKSFRVNVLQAVPVACAELVVKEVHRLIIYCEHQDLVHCEPQDFFRL